MKKTLENWESPLSQTEELKAIQEAITNICTEIEAELELDQKCTYITYTRPEIKSIDVDKIGEMYKKLDSLGKTIMKSEEFDVFKEQLKLKPVTVVEPKMSVMKLNSTEAIMVLNTILKIYKSKKEILLQKMDLKL